MDIAISNADPRPIYGRIADQVRGAVIAGTLAPGEALRKAVAGTKRAGIPLSEMDEMLALLYDERSQGES